MGRPGLVKDKRIPIYCGLLYQTDASQFYSKLEVIYLGAINSGENRDNELLGSPSRHVSGSRSERGTNYIARYSNSRRWHEW